MCSGSKYLIPFKMYAWLDLKNKKQNGEHVNEKDLKKHKYKEEAITILMSYIRYKNILYMNT